MPAEFRIIDSIYLYVFLRSYTLQLNLTQNHSRDRKKQHKSIRIQITALIYTNRFFHSLFYLFYNIIEQYLVIFICYLCPRMDMCSDEYWRCRHPATKKCVNVLNFNWSNFPQCSTFALARQSVIKNLG